MPCNNNTTPTYQPINAVKDLELAIQAAEAINRERRDEMRRIRWRK